MLIQLAPARLPLDRALLRACLDQVASDRHAPTRHWALLDAFASILPDSTECQAHLAVGLVQEASHFLDRADIDRAIMLIPHFQLVAGCGAIGSSGPIVALPEIVKPALPIPH